MRWRMIGPFRGGRVLPALGIPGNPNAYLFGAVGGGVWKTENAGRTWRPIFDAEPIASIGAIAIAPSDPQIIYVGTGEADMRSDISFGDGIYKSTDGGATWSNIGLRDSQQIGSILVDSRDANIVLVAALGHAFGPNPERGVYRSTDGGTKWTKVLGKDDDTGAIDLCADPTNPQIIYASLWQTRRPPWSVYAPTNGPGSGLYKSTDGGVTWNQITGNGFPSEGLGRIGIAIAPSKNGSNGNRIYAVVDAREGGVYRSDDDAQTWRRVSSDARVWQRGWYFGGITTDPRDPNVVYVADTALYRSTDGGENFDSNKRRSRRRRLPHSLDHPRRSRTHDSRQRSRRGHQRGPRRHLDLLVQSADRAVLSRHYGQSFPLSRLRRAARQRHRRPSASRSDYGEITFRDWYPVGGEETATSSWIGRIPISSTAAAPSASCAASIGSPAQSFNISPAAMAVNGSKLRFTWTSPVVIRRKIRTSLYFGSQFVLRTNDATAANLAGHQPRPHAPPTKPGTPAFNAATKRRRIGGVVYTIAPLPAQR